MNIARSLAFVVMPDHLHWLFELEHSSLDRVVGGVKARAAAEVHAQGLASMPLWQRGFHDHALRKDEDVAATARYVVLNPVRAGLVRRVGDYPLWDAIWL